MTLSILFFDSGGLTNKLYLCSLPDGLERGQDEPYQVLMRIYGEIAQHNDYMLRNSIIFALFSEKKKGPKLYGMYPEGRIEEYIPVTASILIICWIFICDLDFSRK